FFRYIAWSPWRRECQFTLEVQAGEEQGIIGQLDQREINVRLVRNASLQTLQAFFLAQEQDDQVFVDLNRAIAALGLWPFEAQTVALGVLDCALDAQCLFARVEIADTEREDFRTARPRARRCGDNRE